MDKLLTLGWTSYEQITNSQGDTQNTQNVVRLGSGPVWRRLKLGSGPIVFKALNFCEDHRGPMVFCTLDQKQVNFVTLRFWPNLA